MSESKIAEKLVAAGSAADRRRALAEAGAFVPAELARAIKEICYASWTTEPSIARKAAAALRFLKNTRPGVFVEAYFFWVSGIADLTRGRLERAIENFDRAGSDFGRAGDGHSAASTQVPKLVALALLGRYDDAIAAGHRTLREFVKLGDELAAGKVEKNLGNIVARQGRESEAEGYYLAARQRFIKVGDRAELAMSDNSLANTYAELNDFRKAEKFYAEALESARSAGMRVTEAEIEASLGNLAKFRGRYGEALRFLELSRRKYEELAMPHQTAIAELEIADIYADLNLADEALAIYAKVCPELKKLKMQGEEARARASFGRVAANIRENRAARKELKLAARLYDREKNPVGAASVRLAEAGIEIDSGRLREALNAIEAAGRFLEKADHPRLRMLAGWIEGEALRRLGEKAAARRRLSSVLKRSSRDEQPHIAQACLGSLGKLAAESGGRNEAESFFLEAIGLIEQLRSPLAGEEFRMAFLSDKLEPYDLLARLYIGDGRIPEAFLLTERARARTLAESLTERTSEMSASELSKPERELQALREELNWFYSRLARAEPDEARVLGAEARDRERRIAELGRRVESTRAGTAGLGTDLDLDTLRGRLGRSSALVEYVRFEGMISAFVVTDEGITFESDLAAETEILSILEGLQFQFGALRYGTASLGPFMAGLKARADAYLGQLYAKILEPLEHLTGGRNLVIVPTGALFYVPFPALFDGKDYLVASREIVTAPGASVWASLAARKDPAGHDVLLVGFADERIPLVDREIGELKRIFPASTALTGPDASFAAYTRLAAQSDVLHLACHGQFRPDNPMFSSLHLADGWITVRDICAQKLRAGLVTLSACETGLNRIFAGEELLGLARGFFSAGATSLVLSLWTVSDEATTGLMKAFYGEMREGAPVSTALRKAQLEFIQRGSHPYFWAPFSVVGSGDLKIT